MWILESIYRKILFIWYDWKINVFILSIILDKLYISIENLKFKEKILFLIKFF